MSTHGARFTAGYQFPRTDHAALKREPPVRVATPGGSVRATVQMVQLTGGRPELFDVCATYTHDALVRTGPPDAPLERRTTSKLYTEIVQGRAAADRAFDALVELFQSGRLPE